jgi:succinoglycan biosynthesis transport protein ExoP
VSRFFGQSASPDTLRPGENASAPQSAASSPADTQPMHSASAEQALFSIDLKRSLQLHHRLAIGIALAGMVLAGMYFIRVWPVYTAQSLVYVQPVTPKVLNTGAARLPYDGSSYQSYIQEQMADVTRPDVLVNALHKLQPGIWQNSGESDQAAAERLSHAIEVTQFGSFEIDVSAHASKPDMAAALSNAVTSSYLDSASREQKQGNKQRIDILSAERDRVQSELTADRSEQESLNKQLGVSALGTGAPDLIDDDIARTRAALDVARTAHDEATAKFSAMGASKGPSSAAIAAEADDMISTDAGLNSMKTSLNARRAALITQMANLTPNHPEYKQDAVELAKINSTLDAMMKDLRTKAGERIEQQLNTSLAQTAGVEAQLNGQLRQLVATAGSAVPKMQRSNDLAADIARLQARYTDVDAQLHDLMLEDGAPGSVFLAEAAVTPLHPTKTRAMRNVVVMVFFFIALGVLAAVAAHKLDPKLYIGSDIEQLLGFAPMAQLPDFTEVPDEVAEEHVLRLAAAIEYARKQGNLKRCIFTGTGHGTGVTTLATRVRETLEGMGRPTVLVDASGAELPEPRAASGTRNKPDESVAQSAAQPGSCSTALLQRVTDESRMEESLVLTDTAPLTVSAETEYLARFVDFAIVVIESGVTTRAELRAVAQGLQRLNVAAVGFVLNRVGMAKADPAFRTSVRAVEQHLHAQGSSLTRRTVRSRHVAVDNTAGSAPSPRAPREDAVPRRTPTAAPEAAGLARAAAPAAQHVPATQEWPSAPVPLPPPPAPQSKSDQPWWLSDASQRPEPDAAAEQSRQPDVEEASRNTFSRLSGLRNILSSQGLDHLNRSRETAPQAGETFPPVESKAPRQAVSHIKMPHAEPVSAAVADSAGHVFAMPEFLPPGPAVTQRDRRDTFDDVEILPSMRGQYKKKE